MRRAVLDLIRAGDVAGGEVLLARMDDVYTFLTTVDYPSAVTRDIKRTNDMVRGVAERTRGDLTVAAALAALAVNLWAADPPAPEPAPAPPPGRADRGASP